MNLSIYVKILFYIICIWIISCFTSCTSCTIYRKKHFYPFAFETKEDNCQTEKCCNSKGLEEYIPEDDTKNIKSSKWCISIHVWCLDYDNNSLTDTTGLTTIIILLV